MKRKSWKIISCVLTATMLIGTMSPMPVKAAETTDPVRIEAEACTELVGAGKQGGGETSGGELGGVTAGGYAKYEGVDFGTSGFSSAVIRAGAYGTGGVRQVEIRIDSPTGQLIGICDIEGTGEWSNYKSFACGLFGNVTGIRDVYLVFKGGNTLYNLNWFELYKPVVNETATQVTGVTLPDVLTGTEIQPTVTPADAKVYYGWYVDGVLSSSQSTYTPTLLDKGKTISVRVTGYGDYAGTAVSEEKTVVVNSYSNLNFDNIAYSAFTSFINEYYTVKNGAGSFSGTAFWDFAEMYEIVIDAYVRTGEERYKNMIDEIWKGFTDKHKTDWSSNEFNDDIMWMVIASVRAYEATGNEEYLTVAQDNFDKVYTDYVDNALGDGTGMWWKKDRQSKNACVNGPASIAACLLAEATGDDTYYAKAQDMVDWIVKNLYENGCVYDNMDLDENVTKWNFTYNQATFVGGATLLAAYYESVGNATDAATYFGYAKEAVDYTIYTKYNAGVMNDETGSQDKEDCHGFKGILPRWFYVYAMETQSTDVMDWMRLNAATAWSNRNSDGIIWTAWGTKAEEKDYYSFGASTAVALFQNIIASKDIVKEGLDGIEAEKFDSCKGIVLSEDDSRVSSIQDGYYTLYNNVDFGDNGAIRAVFTAASARQGGQIEIYLDSVDGNLIGTATIGNTGTWDTTEEFVCEIANTTGMHDVYLVFWGEGDYLFELESFKFSEEELEITDVTVTSNSAYDRIEAESCDEMNGADLGVDPNDEGGNVLSGINHSGYYAVYKDVEFGTEGAKSVIFRASSWSGGTIEIRDGAVDGELLGSCVIPGNNNWDKYTTYTAELDATVTGTKNLYLVFTGNSDMMNLDWFEFCEADKDKKAVTGVAISKGTVPVGTVLTAEITPAAATVNYEWYVGENNTYTLAGVQSTYTVKADDLGKAIRLRVTGYGDYVGSIDSNTVEVTVSAYQVIQAEDCDASEACGGVGGGSQLDGLQNYAYAVYKNLDFGTEAPENFLVRASSGASGGTISVWADGVDAENNGTLLGTVTVPNTGDWSNWVEFECDLAEVIGVHDIYLVFEGNGFLFNVDRFEFIKEADLALTSVSITTKDATGNVFVGDVLRAVVEPDGASVSYEWIVNNEVKGTSPTYKVQDSDAGLGITVKVTGIGRYAGSVTSTATSTVQELYADAYTKIEAEDFVSGDGFGKDGEGTGDEGGGKHLGGVQAGGYAMYKVDFGDEVPVTAAVRASSWNGGTIEIYVDEKDVAENLIGTCVIDAGNNWNVFRTYICDISAEDIAGKHEVYLVFKGETDLYNFNWFRFYTADDTKVSAVSIPTTVSVGDMLQATVSPAEATVTYRWFADGVEVSTDATYTASFADAGKKITVEVTGTGLYSGTATSDETTVTAIETVNAYEEINSKKAIDSNGLRDDGNRYCVQSNNGYAMYAIDFGETSPATITVNAGVNTTGVVKVYLDDKDKEENLIASCDITASGWENYSDYTGAVSVEGVTGKHFVYLVFTASGDWICNFDHFKFTEASAEKTEVTGVSIPADVYVGDTLTATVTPADATVTYKWTVDGTEVSTGATYTVQYADFGKKIQVTVTGGGNYAGTVTSNESNAVTLNYVNAYETINFASAVSYSGLRNDGCVENNNGYAVYAVDFGENSPATITVNAGVNTDRGTTGVVKVYLDDKDKEENLIVSCTIPAANGWEDYKDYIGAVTAEGITGEHLVYLVFTADGGYICNFKYFKYTEADDEKTEVTGVSIPADVYVGDTLTASVTPADATVSYKWTVGGAEAGTGATYTVQYADFGKKIQVTVTGGGNYAGTVTSNESNAVTLDYVNAYETINFASAVSYSGLRNDGCVESNNGYAVYAVDFGETSPATITVNAGVNTDRGTTGVVKVYLDDKDKEENLIASCAIPATNGWDDYKDYIGAVTAEGITGEHLVYLVFTADDGYICNFKYFKYTEASAEKTEVTGVSIPTAVYVGDTLTARVTPEDATVSYKWTVGGAEAGTGATYTVQYADLGKKIQVTVTGSGNYTGTAVSETTNEVKIESIDAYSEIAAESFVLGDLSKDGNELGGIQGTKYVMYANVEFGQSGPASVTFNTSGASTGGKIDIYVDERTAENLIGTCEITPTGDWGTYNESTCELDAEGVVGAHNVYLVFTALNNGEYDAGGFVCNLLWTKFTQSEVSAPASYWLSVSTEEGGTAYAIVGQTGTASSSALWVEVGTKVTLTASPEEGYEFSRWASEDVTVSGNSFIMPEKDVNIIAVFVQTEPVNPNVPNPTPSPEPDSDETTERLAEAREIVEKTLDKMIVSNYTTARVLLNKLNNALEKAKYTDITVTVDDFEIIKATRKETGTITALITLTLDDASDWVYYEFTVSKITGSSVVVETPTPTPSPSPTPTPSPVPTSTPSPSPTPVYHPETSWVDLSVYAEEIEKYDVFLGTSAKDTPMGRTLKVGESVDLNFYGVKNWVSSEYTYKWTSSDESIATVDKKGVVTMRDKGIVIIQLELTHKTTGEKISVAPVEVGVPEADYNVFLGTSARDVRLRREIAVGDKIDLNFYGIKNWKKEDYTYQWISGDESLATVSDLGVITAVSEGRMVLRLKIVNVKTGEVLNTAPVVITVSKKTEE